MDSRKPTAKLTAEPLNSLPDAGDADIWSLFAEMSQRLQVSSASIKAAITSLLDSSIIWDRSVQREFMQSIDKSIDHISSMMVVMTLALQSESGILRFGLEPSSIPEILFRVVDSLEKSVPGLAVTLSLPGGDKLALVDYDYLRIALKLLFEALLGAGGAPAGALKIRAEQTALEWQIHVEGDFTGAAATLIAWLSDSNGRVTLPPAGGVLAEARLKAFTAARLLHEQQVAISLAEGAATPTAFMLRIPHSRERWKSVASS
jgi:hypothetical protein